MGSKEALTEFFEYIKHEAFGKMKNRVAIIVSFKENSVKSALPFVFQYPDTDPKDGGISTLENMILDMIG